MKGIQIRFLAVGITIALAVPAAWAGMERSTLDISNCHVNPVTGTPDKEQRDMVQQYACINNLAACDDPTRLAIKRVDKKWGPFDFFCFDNHVSKLTTQLDSPIQRNHLEFVIENPGLFGLKANPTLKLKEKDRGAQVYKSVWVAAGIYPLEIKKAGWDGAQNWFELSVFVKETRDWTFDPKPRISADTAIQIATREILGA